MVPTIRFNPPNPILNKGASVPTTTSIVTGVDFITIPTKDIDAAVKFYGDVLGLEKSKQWGSMPAHEFETGNLTIALMQSDAFGIDFQASRFPVEFQVD